MMNNLLDLCVIALFAIQVVITTKTNQMIYQQTELTADIRRTEWVKAAKQVNHENKQIKSWGLENGNQI